MMRPETVLRCSLVVAIVAVVSSGFISMRAASERGGPQTQYCNVSRICVATTYCAAVLAWPLLWSTVFGLGMAARFPYMMAALVWGAALTTYDLTSYASATPSEWLTPEGGRLQSEGTALISTAFAVGAVLASQINREVASAAGPSILLAMCLTTAFVIPTVRSPQRPHVACALRAAQRSALNYSQALVLAGLAMALQHSAPRRLRLGELLASAKTWGGDH